MKVAENNRKDLTNPYEMLLYYVNGAFPMADEDTGVISWYQPKDERAIISIENFHVPRSLKQFMKRCDFEYKYDYDLEGIIRGCGDREETWINEDLIEAYRGLIKIGQIKTVEVYQSGKLVGGLYGVFYRKAFFGESMFSKVSQASKCAMVKLVEYLRENEYELLDVQYYNDHLALFNVDVISYEDYMIKLKSAVEGD